MTGSVLSCKPAKGVCRELVGAGYLHDVVGVRGRGFEDDTSRYFTSDCRDCVSGVANSDWGSCIKDTLAICREVTKRHTAIGRIVKTSPDDRVHSLVSPIDMNEGIAVGGLLVEGTVGCRARRGRF